MGFRAWGLGWGIGKEGDFLGGEPAPGARFQGPEFQAADGDAD